MDRFSRSAKILSMVGESTENMSNKENIPVQISVISNENNISHQVSVNNCNTVTTFKLGDTIPLNLSSDLQTVIVENFSQEPTTSSENENSIIFNFDDNFESGIGHSTLTSAECFTNPLFEVLAAEELCQENLTEVALESIDALQSDCETRIPENAVCYSSCQSKTSELVENEEMNIEKLLEEHDFQLPDAKNDTVCEENEMYEPAEEEEMETDSENVTEINVRTRKRRRDVNESTWNKNDNKVNRQAGLPYNGKCKTDTKWVYNLPRSAKTMKARCLCNEEQTIKCKEISDEERNKLFVKFWKLTWGEKKIYLTTLIEKCTTKRARNRKEENVSRRGCSYYYYLDVPARKRVCKTMFCNTFAIPPRTIGHWIVDTNKTQIDNVEAETERELNPRNARINEQKHNMKMFFDSLPKLESHYCRKSSSKLYLEPNWSSKMGLYKLYKNDWCQGNNIIPLSIASFGNLFDDLNLALFSPKKDECDVCVGYKTKNVDENTYQEHLIKKEEARAEKDLDKSGENRKVFTMDVQSVLLCPKSNVSSLYYKTKLIVHNFTLFDLKTKEGYCYLWHESSAGLTSDVFASIIYKFLTTYVIQNDNNDTIILYSDGCTCQNRNATLSNALLNLSQERRIIIVQKYLEKGHTQMECDSMHSTIERKLRKRIINVPADYVQVCQTARESPRPYHVEYLDYTFFRNFEKLKFIPSIRPGRKTGDPTVTDIRALQYNPDGTILFKTRHVEEWKSLPHRYKKQTHQILTYDELPRLYSNPIPIKAEKYQHLMSLKSTLQRDYHDFYDSLPHM